MRFLQWYRDRKARNYAKATQELRDRMAAVLWKSRTVTNEGLLRRMLFNLPGVTQVTTNSGGWSKSSVYVTMRDGYEVCAFESWTRDALRAAIRETIQRVVEVGP